MKKKEKMSYYIGIMKDNEGRIFLNFYIIDNKTLISSGKSKENLVLKTGITSGDPSMNINALEK